MPFRSKRTHPNGTRRTLLDAVASRPGATVADLARAAAVAHTTATYHLRRLEKEQAVVAVRRFGRLHYFVNGQTSADDRARTIADRLGRSRVVLDRIPRDDAAPLGSISAGLPMTKAGVYWHLERLEQLGLVKAEGVPGARVYRAVG